MGDFSIKKELTGNVDSICQRIVDVLKPIGFGILTRIDFDQKVQEKLNEKINRCVILGACNPRLALDAYRQSTDVALFIPCNIVVRELDSKNVVVEAMRPTKMLNFIEGIESSDAAVKAERDLEQALLSI